MQMELRKTALLTLLYVFPVLSIASISCPPAPAVTDVTRDVKAEINAGVGSLGKAKAGEISVKTEVVAKNIFERFPNVDKLVTLQMMSSTYCQLLAQSQFLSDREKLDRWERFQEKVLNLRQPNTSTPTQGTTLKGSYPGEYWKAANKADYAWLSDEWCYPSVPDFVSRFKLEGTQLFRQNEGGKYQYIKTEWIPITVHRSNRNVLRFTYPKEQDWPIDFLEFEPGRTTEWREYTRSLNDDGSVSSNKKSLAISCRRCSVDKLGITYDCKK